MSLVTRDEQLSVSNVKPQRPHFRELTPETSLLISQASHRGAETKDLGPRIKDRGPKA